MRHGHRLLQAAVITGGLVAALTMTAPGHSQVKIINQNPAPAPIPANETITQRLARESGIPEKDVVRLLSRLGPALEVDLKKGNTVTFPGLGGFRVVRLPSYRTLDENGRLEQVPTRNVVEFLPDARLTEAANTSKVVPAAAVPAFEYNPLPDQTPGQRVPGRRMPNVHMH